MSGYSPYDKTPGKSSGVTAPDVAAANDIGTMNPGKKNLVQTPDVGDPWIDGGAKCDPKAGSSVMNSWTQGLATPEGSSDPGCYLPKEKRDRLISEFRRRVTRAETNFKLALEEMRVDELLKKDEDVNWMLGLVLDVASMYIGGSLTKMLVGGKASSRLLSHVSDGALQTAVKVGFDKAKGGIKDGVKSVENTEAHAEKTAELSYIKQLQTGCDIAFERFGSTAAATANDAQLTVLWEGLAPEYHSVDLYKIELTKKLDRFKKSGVPDIGSKPIAGGGVIAMHVFRATRVVWVRGAGGKPTLYFQTAMGTEQSPFAQDGGDMRPVPPEFVDAAIARHQGQWGEIPTIDDPSVAVAEHLLHPKPAAETRPIRRLDLGKKP